MQGSARPVQQPETSFHWAILLLCCFVLGLSAALAVRGSTRVVLPGMELAVPELCMSRRLVGIDCPGCGMTRSFIALAHGDVLGAWTYNPAGPLLFAVMAFQVPYRGLQLWRIRRGRPELSLSNVASVALLGFAVMLIGQWVLRVLA